MGELFYRGARLGPLHVTTETGDLNGDVIEVEKSDMKCFICGLATDKALHILSLIHISEPTRPY